MLSPHASGLIAVIWVIFWGWARVKALILRVSLTDALWNLKRDDLSVAVRSIDLSSDRGLESLTRFVEIPQFYNYLWHQLTHPDWIYCLVLAVLPKPEFHSSLLNSELLKSHRVQRLLFKHSQLLGAYQGIIYPRDQDKLPCFNSRDLLRNALLHNHATFRQFIESKRPWLEAPGAWQAVEDNSTTLPFSIYLLSLAEQSDELTRVLIALKLWCRKILVTGKPNSKAWKRTYKFPKDIYGRIYDLFGQTWIGSLHELFFKPELKPDASLGMIVLGEINTRLFESMEEGSRLQWMFTVLLAMFGRLNANQINIAFDYLMACAQYTPSKIPPKAFTKFLELCSRNSINLVYPKTHPIVWSRMFFHLMRFYNCQVFPYEPYESRFVKWQIKLRDAGPTLTYDSAEVQPQEPETFFQGDFLLSFPKSTSVRMRAPKTRKTYRIFIFDDLLKLAESYISEKRRKVTLANGVTTYGGLSPTELHWLYTAVVYKFAVTGTWSTKIFNRAVVDLWKFGSRRKVSVSAKSKRTKVAVLPWIASLDTKRIRDFFHPNDPCFNPPRSNSEGSSGESRNSFYME